METNNARAVVVMAVMGILRALWMTLRFVLFILVCVLGRFIEPALRLTSGVGVLLFVFGWAVSPKLHEPMWAGAFMTLGGGALLIGFQAARQALAPDGTVIISEL